MFVQLMEVGATTGPGLTARSPVEEGSRTETGPVTTLSPNTGVRSVLTVTLMRGSVTHNPVQVKSFFNI